jgi:hypothetical protein
MSIIEGIHIVLCFNPTPTAMPNPPIIGRTLPPLAPPPYAPKTNIRKDAYIIAAIINNILFFLRIPTAMPINEATNNTNNEYLYHSLFRNYLLCIKMIHIFLFINLENTLIISICSKKMKRLLKYHLATFHFT